MAILGTIETLPPTFHVLCLTSGCSWPAWLSLMERGLGMTFLVCAIVDIGLTTQETWVPLWPIGG